MNYDQWTGIVRSLVPAIVALMAAWHWIPGLDSETVQLVVAAIVAVSAAVWSVFNNKTGKVVGA